MYLFELWFSPDICPGVGLLDHMVALIGVLEIVTLWRSLASHCAVECPVIGLGVAQGKCAFGTHGNESKGAAAGTISQLCSYRRNLSVTFPWLLLGTDWKIPTIVHSSNNAWQDEMS